MYSLSEDVPQTITNVLSTHNWRSRKELIDQVFIDDVHFWHLFHDCKDRKELFGVYQMWGEITNAVPPGMTVSTAVPTIAPSVQAFTTFGLGSNISVWFQIESDSRWWWT